MLPWDRLSHVHKLLIMYNTLLAQTLVVFLFWGLYQKEEEGAETPLLAPLYALFFNVIVTLLVTNARAATRT